MAVIGFIHQSDERIQISNYPLEQYFQSNDFALFINKLKQNDTVVIPELLTIQKSTRQLGEIIPRLVEKNIRLISVKEKIDTAKNPNFYQNVIALANLEKKITKNRINEGIQKAKEKNHVGGRPKTNQKTIKKINDLYHKKHFTIQMTADKLNISVGTVYKYLKKNEKTRNFT